MVVDKTIEASTLYHSPESFIWTGLNLISSTAIYDNNSMWTTYSLCNVVESLSALISISVVIVPVVIPTDIAWKVGNLLKWQPDDNFHLILRPPDCSRRLVCSFRKATW